LPTLCIKGKVFTGKGEGAQFLKLPWVKKQIIEKFSFTPFSGTLNVRVIKDGSRLKKLLARAKAVEILPTEGFYRGKCFRAYLASNLECAIVIPEVDGYPEDTIELISSANLREKLCLKDNDEVEIKIPF
jgi:CTP-dependent riboflavin kinase